MSRTRHRVFFAVRATCVFLCASSQLVVKEPLTEKLKHAAHKAAGGGLAGFSAMFINVGTLMWYVAPQKPRLAL